MCALFPGFGCCAYTISKLGCFIFPKRFTPLLRRVLHDQQQSSDCGCAWTYCGGMQVQLLVSSSYTQPIPMIDNGFMFVSPRICVVVDMWICGCRIWLCLVRCWHQQVTSSYNYRWLLLITGGASSSDHLLLLLDYASITVGLQCWNGSIWTVQIGIQLTRWLNHLPYFSFISVWATKSAFPY